MSDSYDDYEAKIQLAEHAWEKRVVKTEHDKQIEIALAYQRGWDAALAQQEREAIWNLLFEYAGRDDLSDSDQSLLKHLLDLIAARWQARGEK